MFAPSMVMAYDPPVGTAGPLTVRIDRPSTGSYGAGGWVEFTQPGTPFSVLVTLENSGPAPRAPLPAAWKPVPIPRPDSPRFTARVRWKKLYGDALPPRQAEALDESGAVLATKPVRMEGATVAIDIEPGVFAYRLR